jgi:hypothetical protein
MNSLKRIFSICLLLVFFLSTSGLSVYKHYCGEFLASTSFFHKSNPCTDESGDSCEMQKEMDCCEDEFQFIQLDLDLQKQAPVNYDFSKVSLLGFLELPSLNLLEELESDGVVPSGHSPPLIVDKLPLYKQYQRLTYYG